MNLESAPSCPACADTSLRTVDRIARILRCTACGFLFDNPRPDPDAIAAFYSTGDKYEHWLSHESERDGLWKRRCSQILPWAAKGSLLDVGTGTGQFLAHAGRHFSPVCGTEVSASAVEIARKKYGLSVMQKTLDRLAPGTGPFDNITLFHVLEHVPDPQSTIRVCNRLLAPQGIIFIAVPNEINGLRPRVRGLVKFALGRLGVMRFKNCGMLGLPRLALDGSQHEIHLGHFTPGALAGLLTRNGFAIEHAGLDPFYVSAGIKLAFESAYYRVMQVINRLTGINLYDTIWIVARKTSEEP